MIALGQVSLDIKDVAWTALSLGLAICAYLGARRYASRYLYSFSLAIGISFLVNLADDLFAVLVPVWSLKVLLTRSIVFAAVQASIMTVAVMLLIQFYRVDFGKKRSEPPRVS